MAQSSNNDGGVTINVPVGEMRTEGFAPSIWITANFAVRWLEDALNEVHESGSVDARRREIIFAVCFAENYILEWVRDGVLNADFRRLQTYFPFDQRLGVSGKWRDIPRILLDYIRPSGRG